MIVYYFNFECITGPPHEADSELIIHADAVLSFPVSFERFQPVARRHAEVLQCLCTMKHPQFPERRPLYTLRKTYFAENVSAAHDETTVRYRHRRNSESYIRCYNAWRYASIQNLEHESRDYIRGVQVVSC